MVPIPWLVIGRCRDESPPCRCRTLWTALKMSSTAASRQHRLGRRATYRAPHRNHSAAHRCQGIRPTFQNMDDRVQWQPLHLLVAEMRVIKKSFIEHTVCCGVVPISPKCQPRRHAKRRVDPTCPSREQHIPIGPPHFLPLPPAALGRNTFPSRLQPYRH